MKCKNCKNLYNLSDENNVIVDKWCVKKNDNPDIETDRDCYGFECMTNADRIRNMTDEELAEWIVEKDDNWENICKQCKTDTYCEDDIDCKIAILNLLQKEVE